MQGFAKDAVWDDRLLRSSLPLRPTAITVIQAAICHSPAWHRRWEYISLLHALYARSDPKEWKWFQSEYAKTGKKLNMGKSCIRFRGLEDVPLELIGKVLSRITA